MSFLGALFGESSSSSSSSSSTSNADNRIVQGTGAVQATGGSVVNVLDGNAIGSAIDSATDVAKTSIDRNADLSSRSIDGMTGVIRSALDFGSDALGLGGEVVAANGRALTGALDFGSDALGRSLDSSGKTLASAFNFGSDALTGALDFVQDANTQAHNAQSDALSTAVSALSSALSFGKAQTASALDSLNTSASLVKDSYADAKGRGAMTDYLLLAGLAVAGIVAVMALRK